MLCILELPEPLKNCRVSNVTNSTATVRCEFRDLPVTDMDSGLEAAAGQPLTAKDSYPDTYHLEVWKSFPAPPQLVQNISHETQPTFILHDLYLHTEYLINIYSSNIHGKSNTTTLIFNNEGVTSKQVKGGFTI